ncbi:hypothetical protein QTL97_01400 [Sporosarcina thermotolerans]|uniref:Tetratricopeptide repeat protein n=1 Tax=Sporosarcina thermotolerans TaxID=633404 RepID=A0AAW9A3U5_9BACL|nr:hypothetical protein [Sporosarcina thermotolerans]MDW0115592.1 hypothetical protein [Sporosarcina thermotolerans]WHT47109.1 hypothetical protein QNH10_12545 [Sporosarcina thermotolerans]
MGAFKHIDFLLKNNKNEEAFQLILDLKEKSKTLTVDEIGWMYWNLSDIPAILRKAETVYKNHVEFVEWGKQSLFPHKLHWFVSDATQALTLSLGDYFGEWFDWYMYACEHSSRIKDNRGVRFESHRAAVWSLLTLNELSEIDMPLRNMLDVIEEDQNWENKIFAEFTYWTLVAEKAFILDETELVIEAVKNINLLDDEIKGVLDAKADEKESDLFGSWDDLNSSRLNKSSMTVLLHNGACTFHKIERFEESIKLFQSALQNGVTITTYGLSLYLSSVWKINRDEKEIIELFHIHTPDGAAVDDLFQFVPELNSIDWRNGGTT